MHLGRRHSGAGGVADQEGVVARSARQAAGGQRLACRRQVVKTDEVFELAQGRRGAVRQGRVAGFDEFLADCGVDGGRNAPQRRRQRAVGQALAHRPQQLRHGAHAGLRRGPAGTHAFAQLLDQAVDMGRQRSQARDVVAVVFLGREGHLRHQARQAHVQSVPGRDRLRIERVEGEARQLALLVEDEQVERQALLGSQAAAVEGAGVFQGLGGVVARGAAGGQAGVGKARVEAVLADGGGVFGGVAQLPFPVALEQRLRILGRAVRHAVEQGGEQDEEGEESAHGVRVVDV